MDSTPPTRGGSIMSGMVTFWILVGTVVLIGVLFFNLIKPLVLPLFMGAVLAILFRPLFIRCVTLCRGRQRVAAALATVAVVVTVVGPFVWIGDMGIRQISGFLREHLPRRASAAAESDASSTAGDTAEMPAAAADDDSGDDVNSDSSAVWSAVLLQSDAVQKILAWLTPYGVTEREMKSLIGKAATWVGGQVGPKAYDLVGLATRLLIDLFMLIIALYFYFADGPSMLKTLDQLTPLPPGRGAELFWEFENVCRAVVVAMFATAVMNGVLCGLGFLVVGMPHVFFLGIAMMMMSFVPFIGMASVWGAVAIYLYVDGHSGAAIFIAIWCGGFVNTLDHFVKPMLIGGRAKLHPLFVFVSVFGGIHLLGILGIFIGPIVGAVLYALLKILRAELARSEGQGDKPSFIEQKWAALVKQ